VDVAAGDVRFRVSMSMKCWTCDPLTAADKPMSSEWRSEVLLQRVREEDDADACLFLSVL